MDITFVGVYVASKVNYLRRIKKNPCTFQQARGRRKIKRVGAIVVLY